MHRHKIVCGNIHFYFMKSVTEIFTCFNMYKHVLLFTETLISTSIVSENGLEKNYSHSIW